MYCTKKLLVLLSLFMTVPIQLYAGTISINDHTFELNIPYLVYQTSSGNAYFSAKLKFVPMSNGSIIWEASEAVPYMEDTTQPPDAVLKDDFSLHISKLGFQGQNWIVTLAYAPELGDLKFRLIDYQAINDQIPDPNPRMLAFPEAQGFGRYAAGGRGGQLYKVTNLNDSGPGSFREGVENITGPRIIVFNVSGYIDLKTQVEINDGLITIAGQTSPLGITLRGSRLKVKASNVIVRGMRFRAGANTEGDSANSNRDGFGIGSGSQTVRDIIFDHNSASWAVDENASSWYSSQNVTLQNNIFAEALLSDGASYGYLVGTDSGVSPPPSNITFYRNAFLNNKDRNPKVKDNSTNVELINNFGYNWKASGLGTDEGGSSSINAVNNYYKHGADRLDREAFYLQPGSHKVYLSGNIDNCYRPDANTGNETDVAHGQNNGPVDTSIISDSPVFEGSGINPIPAAQVADDVLASVGAIHPVRDSIDTRIINTIQDSGNTLSCPNGRIIDLGKGKVIFTENEAGGYPAITGAAAPATDTDNDGIPDYWEKTKGLDYQDSTDANVFSPSGYTWIEEYINEFYWDGS